MVLVAVGNAERLLRNADGHIRCHEALWKGESSCMAINLVWYSRPKGGKLEWACRGLLHCIINYCVRLSVL